MKQFFESKQTEIMKKKREEMKNFYQDVHPYENIFEKYEAELIQFIDDIYKIEIDEDEFIGEQSENYYSYSDKINFLKTTVNYFIKNDIEMEWKNYQANLDKVFRLLFNSYDYSIEEIISEINNEYNGAYHFIKNKICPNCAFIKDENFKEKLAKAIFHRYDDVFTYDKKLFKEILEQIDALLYLEINEINNINSIYWTRVLLIHYFAKYTEEIYNHFNKNTNVISDNFKTINAAFRNIWNKIDFYEKSLHEFKKVFLRFKYEIHEYERKGNSYSYPSD